MRKYSRVNKKQTVRSKSKLRNDLFIMKYSKTYYLNFGVLKMNCLRSSEIDLIN